ncbi:MAG: hypothetical protein ACI82H_001111 [Alphaproteobacteria bacterium]|jgi:hypothetical protein
MFDEKTLSRQEAQDLLKKSRETSYKMYDKIYNEKKSCPCGSWGISKFPRHYPKMLEEMIRTMFAEYQLHRN